MQHATIELRTRIGVLVCALATCGAGRFEPTPKGTPAPSTSEAPEEGWGEDATVPPPPDPTTSTRAPASASTETPAPRKRKRVRGIVLMAVGGGLLGAGWAASSLVGGIAAGLGREDGLYMLVPVAGPIVWFTLLGRDHRDYAPLYAISAVLLSGMQIAGLAVLVAGGVVHARDRRANAPLTWEVGRPRWAVRSRTTRQLSLGAGGVQLRF